MAHSYDFLLAGLRLRVLAPRELTVPENFRPFLVPEEGKADVGLWVDFGPERQLCRREDGWQLTVAESMTERFCRQGNWLSFFPLEQLLLPFGRVMLHASAVVYEGRAYVFTAPSGTGKSTQAAIWERELGAEVINGDKIILEVSEHGCVAHGGPAAGTSGIYKRVSAPVAAILSLRQSPVNRLHPSNGRSGYFTLFSEVVKSRDDPAFNQALLPLIESILATTPVLTLDCRPDRSAAECVLEQMARAGKR